MTLNLTGISEKTPEPHREFYGELIRQMPLLVNGTDKQGNIVDVPRAPTSFAYVLERRMNAPEDARPAWQHNYFFTGDGSVAGTIGDHLIVLEDLLPAELQFLRGLNHKSELYNGALVLPTDAWNELKNQKEDTVLHLTAEEVEEAQSKGYILENKVWVPANKTVGKVWEGTDTFPGLARRGINVREYAQLVSERFPNRNSLLNVYFNTTRKYGQPTMRLLVANRIDYYSLADGDYDLYYYSGRLVGVAPEAPAVSLREAPREKTTLEERVLSALETGKAFEFNGRVYAPVSGVSPK